MEMHLNKKMDLICTEGRQLCTTYRCFKWIFCCFSNRPNYLDL